MPDNLITRLKLPLRAVLVRAAAHRRARLPDTRFVGITGSCGKTTTKEILADCLAQSALCTRSRESNNNIWSVSKTILRTTRQHRFAVCEVGVKELGNMPPMAALLRPHIAMVTCIAPAHTEGLLSLDNIAREKSGLLGALEPGGTAILLKEEPYFDFLRGAIPRHARLVTVSMQGGADYTGAADRAGESFEIVETASGGRRAAKLPIPGRAQMINSLFAVAAARVLGVEWDGVVRALEGFRGVSLRWQTGECRGITIINDAYNANPASMRMAMETFAGMNVAGRKWLVLGGMRELGARERDDHLAVGGVVAQRDWAGLFAIGEWGAVIAAGARAAGFAADRVVECADARAAARALTERVKAGDAVLIKASRGFELERVEVAWRRMLQRGA